MSHHLGQHVADGHEDVDGARQHERRRDGRIEVAAAHAGGEGDERDQRHALHWHWP